MVLALMVGLVAVPTVLSYPLAGAFHAGPCGGAGGWNGPVVD